MNENGPGTRPYDGLTPDLILDSLDAAGFPGDARLLALNSYENRVYQAGQETGSPVVVKFYRPGRWSNEAILEEHAFATELAQAEVPVVAPFADADGVTLHEYAGFRFAVFPRRGGRAPEPGDLDQLEWIGRFLGRLHAIGAAREFAHRPAIDRDTFAREPFAQALDSGFVPESLRDVYASVVEQILPRLDACYERAGKTAAIRLHGDCHLGNILWTDAGPHFVDLDDCRSGPAVQDLWMMLAGERDEVTRQLDSLLEGYSVFREFDLRELYLLEALRTMRMLYYSAWLARRWEDPAFPRAFPWFATPRYWEEQILALREQAAALEEAPPLL